MFNGKFKENKFTALLRSFSIKYLSGKGEKGLIKESLPVFIVVGAVIGMSTLTSFYKIEPGEQGVVVRFGAFHDYAFEGPHFKLPFGIDQVYTIRVSRVHELQFGFRKEGPPLSEENVRLESLMLTGDLNVAFVEWILQYVIHDPKQYLFSAENVEKTIRDISISTMRRVVGDKLVGDVLTTSRVMIAEQARKLTQEILDHFSLGVTVSMLQMQNVTPPELVKPAFNEVNIAKQEKEQVINQAKGHYNKVIPEAEGKAGRVISEAEAFAIDTVNRAHGDSEKFKQVLTAYQEAPEITRKRLYLETIEEVFSQMDHFTIVDAKIQGILPLLGKQTVSLGNKIKVPEETANPQPSSGM